MPRAFPYALAFLLAVSPCSALAAAPPRDWAAFPAVVTVDHVSSIDALGDIHGDYEKATHLLAGTHLIRQVPTTPAAVEWTGGNTTLVCTGDMIDKGPQSLEVLQLLRALQASAAAHGGKVIVTLGNHEAEFLAAHGDNKKSTEFQEELTAHHLSPTAVADGQDPDGLGSWLRNLPVAAKVDDWFFCHAGNTFGSTLPALESALENGINTDGFGTFILAQPNSLLEARMHPVPWWLSPPPKKTPPASNDSATPSPPSAANTSSSDTNPEKSTSATTSSANPANSSPTKDSSSSSTPA